MSHFVKFATKFAHSSAASRERAGIAVSPWCPQAYAKRLIKPSVVPPWLKVFLLALLIVPPGRSHAEEPAKPVSTTSERSSVTVHANQRYSDADEKGGLCDVYVPSSEPPTAGFPVALVVHGGGWMSGDKWTLEGYSRQLARNGFVAITINYRLAPAHTFPAQLDDVRQATWWIQENAERWNIDVHRLGLFGYSAGGHLCALLASLADASPEAQTAASRWDELDPRWKRMPVVKAICVGGPPCDFRQLPLDNTTLAYFLGGSRREKPELYCAASPLAHVSSADPTTLVIHGDADVIVPLSSGRDFHETQVKAGVDSRIQIMSGQGHIVTFLNPKTCESMIEFFQEVL